jgi:hypothetical protein
MNPPKQAKEQISENGTETPNDSHQKKLKSQTQLGILQWDAG